MTDDEFERWIAAYIARQASDAIPGPDNDPQFWAVDTFFRLNDEDPALCWKAILEILGRKPGDKVLGVLAAGPLEDLVGCHGPAFIDRIDAEARRNPDFRSLLGGVWQASTPEVWQRVLRARGRAW